MCERRCDEDVWGVCVCACLRDVDGVWGVWRVCERCVGVCVEGVLFKKV